MSATQTPLLNTKIQESDYSDNNNQESESNSQFLEPRKDKDKKSDSEIIEGKWSDAQKLKYIYFVYHHLKIFKSKTKRKNLRVFKTLSEFLVTRTPRQCRSHFQKLMNRFKNLKKMIDFQQCEVGIAEFSQTYKNQVKKIQCYPLEGQNFQKPSVACRQFGCQTQFPDIYKEYAQATYKLKYLENLMTQSNYFFVNQPNFGFSHTLVGHYPQMF